MRCTTLLALAGCASLSYATARPAMVGFENCTAKAQETLQGLASDSLEVATVVHSMLSSIDKTTAESVVAGSVAANVRELVKRWFGEAALPENAIGDADLGEDKLYGFGYLKGFYDRMQDILRPHHTEYVPFRSPTLHCAFQDEPCRGNKAAAWVPYESVTEIHICPLTLNQFNQTWEHTKAMLQTQVPNYYDWGNRLGFRVIIHELAHLRGVSESRIIPDRTAAFYAPELMDHKQEVVGPLEFAQLPASAQWLAAYAPDYAMLNADNYAGFAVDIAYLSEGHMPPAWDWELFGLPDVDRRTRGGHTNSSMSAHNESRSHQLEGR